MELRRQVVCLQEKVDALFSNCLDFIVIVDTHTGQIVDANAASRHVISCEPSEIVGRHFSVLYADDEDGDRDQLVDSIRAHDSILERELVTPSGGKVPVDQTAFPAPWDGKQAILVTFRNASDRRQAERRLRYSHNELQEIVADRTLQLRQANEALQKEALERSRMEQLLRQAQKMQAIGTLAGGIAHDFNNILFAMMAYTELALDDVPEASPAHANLTEVLKASQRAKELIKQILAFSRESEQEKQPIEPGLIVKEGLKFLRASIPTSVEIRWRFEKDLPWVVADATQIHQVLMNLCANATHAMKGEGRLDVRLKRVEVSEAFAQDHPPLQAGPHVMMTVADTGYGMSAEVMDRIFEPYFTTKKQAEGTGLGLAVVHGIVKNHGGAITVESKLGQGTTFSVYLPAFDQHVVREKPSARPVPRGSESILVVDDETALVKIFQRMLKSMGYRVQAFSSSPDALEAFQAAPDSYDLVITDMNMPHMTGIELTRALISLKPQIPVIVCTGFSEWITAEQVEALGIRAVIMKPVLKSQMAEAIRRVLDEERRKGETIHGTNSRDR